MLEFKDTDADRTRTGRGRGRFSLVYQMYLVYQVYLVYLVYRVFQVYPVYPVPRELFVLDMLLYPVYLVPGVPAAWGKRQRTRTGRGPDAGRMLEFKDTDADRTRTGRGRGRFSLRKLGWRFATQHATPDARFAMQPKSQGATQHCNTGRVLPGILHAFALDVKCKLQRNRQIALGSWTLNCKLCCTPQMTCQSEYQKGARLFATCDAHCNPRRVQTGTSQVPWHAAFHHRSGLPTAQW
eukprot:gene15873-biopygen21746